MKNTIEVIGTIMSKLLPVTIITILSVIGLVSLISSTNYERKIDNLEKQIEDQTMLIEILKRSCE